jgi:hypothetical protein
MEEGDEVGHGDAEGGGDVGEGELAAFPEAEDEVYLLGFGERGDRRRRQAGSLPHLGTPVRGGEAGGFSGWAGLGAGSWLVHASMMRTVFVWVKGFVWVF